MRNKGAVILLTIVITALCLYYLSFAYISSQVRRDAEVYATQDNGLVSLTKKQHYIDSVWNEPVYNLFGALYTYKEVKENELSLGLDLQGGMHVTLEVSPEDIIRGLSGNAQDSSFVAAMRQASIWQKDTHDKYVTLFYRALVEQKGSDFQLASYFVSLSNKGRISLSDDNEIVLDFLDQEVEEAVDRSFTIIKNRIDQFGASQPNVQRLQGTGRIQIEIPGADNPKRVRKLLQSVAHLEFWNVVEFSDKQLSQSLLAIEEILKKETLEKIAADNANITADTEISTSQVKGTAQDSLTSTLEKQLKDSKQEKDETTTSLDSLQQNTLSPLFALSTQGNPFLYPVKDTATINKILAREDILALLPSTVKYLWDVKPDPELTPGIEDLRLHFLRKGRSGKPLLTGENINDARLDYDAYGRPAVNMTMDATGSRIWAKVTAAAAGKTPQGRIAIVMDNAVYTTPTVTGTIPNGNSQITGNFEIEEAKDLSNILRAGSLPVPTRIVEEAVIGPTLGKTSQKQGFVSMMCGLVIVALFMIAYYNKGGWVANVALLFNIFFILGILAQLNAALTLPGIAGIVLTMGMAVDANVLVYERIKEELKTGRVIKDAVNRGYQRAFNSIFDSNATTLLTAILLFLLGQGPLRSFAIVLIIGIATSFFSTIYISRVVLEWMVRKGDASRVSFNSFMAKRVGGRKKFEFIRYRRIAYVISLSVILLGFILIAFRGLNLGVDFKGGRSYVVAFNKPLDATAMKLVLSSHLDNAPVEVKNYGSNRVIKVTTSYLVDDESSEADASVRNMIVSGIQSYTGLTFLENETALDDDSFTILSSSKVGATIADDTRDSAYESGIAALIAIFIYILIRFKKWQFSVGAIIATAHDALFVLAIFGIVDAMGISFEIGQVFVAALLTVIGYSINDTVIIFDRIREYTQLGVVADRLKMFNDAINSTLSRTIITSGTTLVVVLILLFFGGEVLRGFSFALLVGILVGTFSSIFIASPVVYDMQKKM